MFGHVVYLYFWGSGIVRGQFNFVSTFTTAIKMKTYLQPAFFIAFNQRLHSIEVVVV